MHMIKKEPIFYLYWLNATFVLIKDNYDIYNIIKIRVYNTWALLFIDLLLDIE